MDVDAEIDELLSDNEHDPRSSPPPAASSEQECKWDSCGERFAEQANLVKHLHEDHIGAGKDVYVCQWNDCSRRGQKQATRHSLITHCRAHTGERPYTCPRPNCGKTFTRSDAMNKHLKSLHGPGNENKKRAKEADSDSAPQSRRKRPGRDDKVLHDILSDPDLYDVVTRLEARGSLPGVTPEDEEMIRSLRERIKQRDGNDSDDSFDEGMALRVPAEPVEVAQAVYDGTNETIPVLSRSRWQVRYIMAKAKLMLVEEENVMRRAELAAALDQERKLLLV